MIQCSEFKITNRALLHTYYKDNLPSFAHSGRSVLNLKNISDNFLKAVKIEKLNTICAN